MSKKEKKLVEVIPSTDSINLSFRQIVATEVERLKGFANDRALTAEDHSNLKSLASTYKTVESESRDQQQADGLNRLSREELIALAAKVIQSLPEKERKQFILEMVSSNQKLLA